MEKNSGIWCNCQVLEIIISLYDQTVGQFDIRYVYAESCQLFNENIQKLRAILSDLMVSHLIVGYISPFKDEETEKYVFYEYILCAEEKQYYMKKQKKCIALKNVYFS